MIPGGEEMLRVGECMQCEVRKQLEKEVEQLQQELDKYKLVASGDIGKVIMDLYLAYMDDDGYKKLNKLYKNKHIKIFIQEVKK